MSVTAEAALTLTLNSPSVPPLIIVHMADNNGPAVSPDLADVARLARQLEVIVDQLRRKMAPEIAAMKHWTAIWLTDEESIVSAGFMKRFEGFAVPCFADEAMQGEERERFLEKVAEEGLGEVRFINPDYFPGRDLADQLPATAA